MGNFTISGTTDRGNSVSVTDDYLTMQAGATGHTTLREALAGSGAWVCAGYSELATAYAAAVAAGKYVLLIPEAISVSADLTIPATFSLIMLPGGVTTIATGVTLTINGAIDAGDYQIFSLTGTGTLAGTPLIREFPLAWLGFANSTTTDQGTLLNAALNMFDNMEYVATPGYSYAYGTAISVSTKNSITFNGNHAAFYDLGHTIDVSDVGIADQRTFVGMAFDDIDYLELKNFDFHSNNDSGAYTATTGTDVVQGIRITNSTKKVKVSGIDLYGYVGPVNDASALPVGTEVVDYQRSGFIGIGGCNDVELDNCELKSTSGNGEIFIFGDCKNVHWHTCRCFHGYNTTDLTNGGFTAGSIVAQTSGKLIIGRTYIIDTYVAGDDFTNVGGTNTSGTVFVATGIAPATWSNSSSLRGAPGRTGATTFWSFGKVINCDNQIIEGMDVSSWSTGSFIDISAKDRATIRDISLGMPLGGFLDVTQEWTVCNIDTGTVNVENITGVYKTGIFSTCAASASANECSVDTLNVKNMTNPNGTLYSIAKHTFMDGIKIETPVAATTHQNIGVLTYPREDRNYDYACDCHINHLNAYGLNFNFASWKGITTVSNSTISTPRSTAAPGVIIIKSQLERQNVGSAITSGTLTTGQRYWIETYVSGDDFTNVGGTNTSGMIFVATGTTPTTWTNASTLHTIGIYGYSDPEQKVVFENVTFSHALVYIRTNAEFHGCKFYDCKFRTGSLGYDFRLNVYFDADCEFYGIGHDTLVSTASGWVYSTAEGDYRLTIGGCKFLGSVENTGGYSLLEGLNKSTYVVIDDNLFDVSRYSGGNYVVMPTVSYTNVDPVSAGKVFTFTKNHLQGLSNGIDFVGTSALSPTYYRDVIVDGNTHTSTDGSGTLLSTSGTSLDCMKIALTNNTSTVQDLATIAATITGKDSGSIAANNNGPFA